MSVETSTAEMEIKKGMKKNRIFKNRRTITKGITYTDWEYQRRRKKGTEGTFEAIMTLNSPPANARHQTTDTRSSENTMKDKCPHLLLKIKNQKQTNKNYTWAYHFQTTKNQR